MVKRGGEILQWGAKFDSPAWKLYDSFIKQSERENISGKFASALALYLKPYQLEETMDKDLEVMHQIINADFALVCSRQGKEKSLPPEFVQLAESYANELKEKKTLSDFPKLFLSAAFLTRTKPNGEQNA